MHPYLTFIITGCVIFIALISFSILSAFERHKKAHFILLLFAILFAFVWIMLGLLYPQNCDAFAYTVIATILITLVILTIPFSKPKKLEFISDKTDQIDERITVFARDYLTEDSESFAEFYENLHPELRILDAKIRKMPFPGEPGGKLYDEIKSNQANALFDVINENRHLVEPKLESNGKKITRTPEEFTSVIKKFAKYLGVLDIRITKLQKHHLYSHIGRNPENWGQKIASNHKFAIAFTTEMDYFLVRQAPNPETLIESARQYNRIANIALILVKYINRLGFTSRAHIDGDYHVLCTAVAHDAGIGELSRMGLIVTPKHGPRVRIGVVTTEIPLVADEPRTFGVQNFCEICKICADKCPSGAIDKNEKHKVNGVTKWQSKQENCFQYWKSIGTDCGICLDSCPYSAPRNVFHNFMRFIIKRNPIARRMAILLSKILY